jgi:RimJ/RimL family protein N-acetyltransferase
VKQALIDRCFEKTDIHKVEAEVIGANLWSLKVLHGIDDIMTEEGRVRETVYIDGHYYDRIFFGITRSVWQALREG